MADSLGIVLPAYDPDVSRLRWYADAIEEQIGPAELLIEIDAPSPGVLERLADAPATVHASDRRRGKGAAITAGFERLETDRLAFADADGATPVADVERVVRGLDGADVSVGSRRHPDAGILTEQSIARKLLGDGFAWVARRLLPVKLYDYQCGAKAITAPAWRRIRNDLRRPGFAWDLEFVTLAYARGHEIAEVPITWEDQPNSKVDPIGTSLELGIALLRLRHRNKRIEGSRLHRLLDGQVTERDSARPLVDRDR
jgi:glycosyltransferase involved in cell wall biosynthesis